MSAFQQLLDAVNESRRAFLEAATPEQRRIFALEERFQSDFALHGHAVDREGAHYVRLNDGTHIFGRGATCCHCGEVVPL